jgi:hypothetical protein
MLGEGRASTTFLWSRGKAWMARGAPTPSRAMTEQTTASAGRISYDAPAAYALFAALSTAFIEASPLSTSMPTP